MVSGSTCKVSCFKNFDDKFYCSPRRYPLGRLKYYSDNSFLPRSNKAISFGHTNSECYNGKGSPILLVKCYTDNNLKVADLRSTSQST
jgi:hypothetical protein